MEEGEGRLNEKLEMAESIFYQLPQETCTKSIVVAQYMKVLACEALRQNLYPDAGDFSKSMIEKLEISGKWYDIGLAGIEQAHYREHPQLGMEILDILSGDDIEGRYEDELWCVAMDCCMEHHENWDGSGYPCGLYQDEIHIMGRICAICNDFYDIVQNRSTKQIVFPFTFAVREIERGSGTRYDPRLIQVLASCSGELEEVRTTSYQKKVLLLLG